MATRRILKHSFILMNVDYVELGKKWNYKNIISPYYRVYMIDEGEGYIMNEGQTCLLEPGYMYIIPSFTLCNLYCPEHLSQYFIHFFEESPDGLSIFKNNRTVIKLKATLSDISNFKRLYEINPGRKINRSDNPQVYEKSIYYKEYQDLNNKQSDGMFLETQGILLQLLAKFLESEKFERKDISTIPSKVVALIDFIQLNLNRQLTVGELAKKVNLHPDYFSRLFFQLTGERPLLYINGKRIERAQYLTVTTDMPIAQIAQETGFENMPHFSKMFKKITGLTPRQYKEQNQYTNRV